MKTIDLILFAGQSNMAGRGITNEQWPMVAPTSIPDSGYEFRAISDPTKLYPIEEPFGMNENNPTGINDVFEGGILAKTGSMVTSFCNTYYKNTQVPIIAVSASKGGSNLAQWQLDSPESYLTDAMHRYMTAKKYLFENGYQIRHEYMLWCQGESDGDLGTSKFQYQKLFNAFWREIKKTGIEKCFMVQIGFCQHTDIAPSQQKKLDKQYQTIQDAIEEIPIYQPDIAIVSRAFVSMRKRGLMKDSFHYFQQAYNECGEEAGNAVSNFTH